MGGVGLVGLGVGTVFGVMASSAWSSAKSACEDIPSSCTAPAGRTLNSALMSAYSDRSRTETDGTISTAGFIAGGVLVAAGAAVFLTGRRHEEGPAAGVTVAPSIGPGRAGVGLNGVF